MTSQPPVVEPEGESHVKRIIVALFLASFAAGLMAQEQRIHYYPARDVHAAKPGGGGSNITYHTGAPIIPSAKVVFIFWGPSFSNAASPDSSYASQLQSFRNQFGSTPEFNTITQYYQIIGG